ncbi:MAG TPA: hypothetical protein DCX31_03630 [Aquificaceae bacterium]|nr:hypothetical protein [Aquificaceae bacterium]HCO39373.1 hypothetical protein [Aquificaceae bacterium]
MLRLICMLYYVSTVKLKRAGFARRVFLYPLTNEKNFHIIYITKNLKGGGNHEQELTRNQDP